MEQRCRYGGWEDILGVKEGWEHEKRVHIMHARVGWREVRNVEGGYMGRGYLAHK
jgi:hypothetical protein